MSDRNLTPHRSARAATWLWGRQYSEQRLGCMDWYDSLPENWKVIAREMVESVVACPPEEGP